MTSTELHAISYWRACHALRKPLAPAERAMVVDTFYDLATKNTGRVRDMAARVVWPKTQDEPKGAA